MTRAARETGAGVGQVTDVARGPREKADAPRSRVEAFLDKARAA